MHKAQICLTVMADNMAELRKRRDAASDVDLVELRLDSVPDPDVQAALNGRRCPVIITCRSIRDGGLFRGSEEERRKLLLEAVDSGADYVDMEWNRGFESVVKKRGGRNVVLSMHDFKGIPRDLHDQYRTMQRVGAAVVKIAVTATRLCDLLPLLEIGQTTTDQDRAVVIGMGVPGLASRILASRFGSRWTYAGNAAPGQVDSEQMLEEFRYRKLTSNTEVFGVVGNPISHSISPALHNASFAEQQRDAVYLPLEAYDVADFARFAKALSIKGASITAPFKQTMLKQVKKTDSVAKLIGAVNTIRAESDCWSGINTDVEGFLAPLKRRIKLKGLRASVLGAGGAARAVTVALSQAGAIVSVHARRLENAKAVASLGKAVAGPWPPLPKTWDLLVNTTPVGTFPNVNKTPMERDHLDGRLVYDLVYNPTQTRLMKDASQQGCDVLGGLEMLVAQAQVQAEWWTGAKPNPIVMEQAAMKALDWTVKDS